MPQALRRPSPTQPLEAPGIPWDPGVERQALAPGEAAEPEAKLGASALYHRLRAQLLGEVLRHRQGAALPGLPGQAHQMHHRTTQRQLGALRQAYRRTQEAAAWRAYRVEVSARAEAA